MATTSDPLPDILALHEVNKSSDIFRDAARRIRNVAKITPLIDVSHAVADIDGASHRLFVKCEMMQPTGAFKIRGAYNFIAQLSSKKREAGLIACSSGNHGQAVAMAAYEFGVPAVIVMPTNAVQAKIDGVRRFGAEILFEGTTSAERRTRGESVAQERGLTVVPPFDHESIIAGQGTVGIEILDQCPDVSAVYVPVGGGGLIAGVAAAIKMIRPEVRVIGVEPVGAAKMGAALEAGQPVRLNDVMSIADGLLAERAGVATFDYVREFVDDMVAVEEHQIASAVLWLFQRTRLVVEPSGAVGVAAILAAMKSKPSNSPHHADSGAIAGQHPGATVAVLSGGNIDLELLMTLPALAGGAHALRYGSAVSKIREG